MLEYDKTVKLYLFKDKGFANISIMVSPRYVITYTIEVPQLEEILENWQSGDVVRVESRNCRWMVENKMRCMLNYVRLAIWHGGAQDDHRLTYEEMQQLTDEYYHQKSNVMYWD